VREALWNYDHQQFGVLEHKGIRSRPVAGIIEYFFQKCNEYFVDRWNKARSALETSQVLGKIAHEHIKAVELRSVNQIGITFGPERMIYSIRGAGGTDIGGESHASRNYKVDLRIEECTCMLPNYYTCHARIARITLTK
jgi:hypothetical protein